MKPQLTPSTILSCFQENANLCCYTLTRSSAELLSKEDQLNLIVDGKNTSTSNTTKNVSSSSLEERLDTFSCNNLVESIERRAILDGLITIY
jgi:hypothetical protein